jgi:8-oxo-dGTP diphosphatase
MPFTIDEAFRERPLMEDWRDAPVFGVCIEAERYTVRPSAYGLVEDGHGQLAVVRTPQGITLPGGGIEEGETTAQAVVRESLEECGLVVRVGSWAIRAVQFIYSEPERTHFEKWSTFVDATVEAVASSGTEADHELVWMTPETASEVLLAESHRWAVQARLNRRGA